jgi:hypothetical protein
MQEDVIDLSLDHPWVPQHWIRQGKVYPFHGEEPQTVYEEHKRMLTIPLHYQVLLIDPRLTVNQFLQVAVPSVAGDIVAYKPVSAFSTEAPTQVLPWLLNRRIPSMDILEKLEEQLGQQWFDGANSLMDW